MSGEKGIGSILALIEGLKLVGLFAKKVGADGKVSAEDLPAVIDLVLKADVIIQAVKGAGELPAEAKDLQVDEVQEIVAKLYEAAKAVQAV